MADQSPDDIASSLIGAIVISAIIITQALTYRPAPPAQTAEWAPTRANPAAVRQWPDGSTTAPITAGTPTSPTTVILASTTPTLASTAAASSPTTQAAPLQTLTATPMRIAAHLDDHYWFHRPIGPDGTDQVSRFYPYGSTAGGRYEVHHGVEFENPIGTPVLAVGSGKVVVAGSDSRDVYGLFPNFYGRLVVIEHDRTFLGQPVFTLYGHLNTVRVQPGQPVETGQIIGEVGMTGIALGPHVHFETRVGANTYATTRNPELWIQPLDGYGTIAGRLLAPDGQPIPGALITLYDANDHWWAETETYGDGVNPDEGWQENFVFGDVLAGRYHVQVVADELVYTETVEVEAGRTALVILEVSE